MSKGRIRLGPLWCWPEGSPLVDFTFSRFNGLNSGVCPKGSKWLRFDPYTQTTSNVALAHIATGKVLCSGAVDTAGCVGPRKHPCGLFSSIFWHRQPNIHRKPAWWEGEAPRTHRCVANSNSETPFICKKQTENSFNIYIYIYCQHPVSINLGITTNIIKQLEASLNYIL